MKKEKPRRQKVASKDLRTWIEKLESEGEFKRVKAKVDCGGEIQEIGRQMSARQGPAVLFENIEGYKDTWCTKLFIGSLNTFSKVSLALGLPRDTASPVMIDKLRETLRKPIEPTHVDTGPVKRNIIKANKVDLNEIPVPLWHPRDVGRYINTWAAAVTKDPETGEFNVGVYRGVIKDKNHIACLLVRTQGWGRHYTKYVERGEPMPVACIYGWDPSLILTAASPVTTIGEWEWMGAIRGEPVPLVKCETVDLEVPATAEIVIEGFISSDPATYQQEGPLKEISGRYCDPALRPVIEVNCITYRDDPIMVGSAIGLAPILEEQLIPIVAGTAAVLRNALDDQGVPGVLDLTLSPFFAVKIKKMFQGHAYQVASTLFGHKALSLPFKMLVVVEDDVDIYDPRAVLGAINNNVDPSRDIYVFPTQNVVLDSALSEADLDMNEYGAGLGNKFLIDATVNWKVHHRQEQWGGARIAKYEPPLPEDVAKVERRWAEYGLD